MESRSFIKQAKNLSRKLESATASAMGTAEEATKQREILQKELTQLFSGLQNPTLMAAADLRDVAIANGFTVEPKVQHQLTKGESCWY